MNESANDQGSVVGKAVGTTLGLSASVALTGAGLLMGRKAAKGIGSKIKSVAADTASSAKSIYQRKMNGDLLPRSGELLKTRPYSNDTRTFVRTARGGARRSGEIKVSSGNRV